MGLMWSVMLWTGCEVCCELNLHEFQPCKVVELELNNFVVVHNKFTGDYMKIWAEHCDPWGPDSME